MLTSHSRGKRLLKRRSIQLIVLFGVLAVGIVAILQFVQDRGIATGTTVPRGGEQIAFIHYPPGKGGNIYILDAVNGDRTQLTHSENVRVAVWSPDGERLAFSHDDGDVIRLYVLEVSSGELMNLTPEGDSASVPRWSSDGDQLLFLSDGISVINADGSNRHEVVEGIGSASWSSDDSQLVYIALESVDDNQSTREVYIANADGSDARRLISHDGAESAPQWSPDGAHILFLEDIHDQWGGVVQQFLYVVEADGSNMRQLAEIWPFRQPQWSPDGQRIVYNEPQRGAVCTVDISGDEPACAFLGDYPQWHPDGEHILYVDESAACIGVEPGECLDSGLEGFFYLIGWRP